MICRSFLVHLRPVLSSVIRPMLLNSRHLLHPSQTPFVFLAPNQSHATTVVSAWCYSRGRVYGRRECNGCLRMRTSVERKPRGFEVSWTGGEGRRAGMFRVLRGCWPMAKVSARLRSSRRCILHRGVEASKLQNADHLSNGGIAGCSRRHKFRSGKDDCGCCSSGYGPCEIAPVVA